MNARVLGLRALPITFAIYALEALLAVFAVWPNGVDLAAKLQTLSFDPASLRELATLARGVARGHALALSALMVLAPWLHMSWLIMLSEPQSPLRALARGVRSLPRAWGVTLLLGFTLLLCLIPVGGACYGVVRTLGDDPDARRTDLTLLAALLPIAPIAFYFHAAHDLARAAALELRAVRSVLRGLRRACRPAAFLAALGASLAGLLLPLAAHASSWQLGALPATMLLQSVLLVRLVVRAAWLGRALSLVREVDRKYDE